MDEMMPKACNEADRVQEREGEGEGRGGEGEGKGKGEGRGKGRGRGKGKGNMQGLVAGRGISDEKFSRNVSEKDLIIKNDLIL